MNTQLGRRRSTALTPSKSTGSVRPVGEIDYTEGQGVSPEDRIVALRLGNGRSRPATGPRLRRSIEVFVIERALKFHRTQP